eukprot:750771-Hanusia_phi.AAC.3
MFTDGTCSSRGKFMFDLAMHAGKKTDIDVENAHFGERYLDILAGESSGQVDIKEKMVEQFNGTLVPLSLPPLFSLLSLLP